jgi:adenine/guanine phosphoribosyltransferase-like PRPP-binding protein
MMFTNRLDNSRASGLFTLAYRFKDDAGEPWTRRINDFKRGVEKSIVAACQVLPVAMKGVNIQRERMAVAGALCSKDVAADPASGVFRLGAAVAAELGLPWRPHSLTKIAPTVPLHSMYVAHQRKAEIDGKYRAHDVKDLELLIVVDDIYTVGDTMSEIARAAKEEAGPQLIVVAVTLGKSEGKGPVKMWFGADLNNDHVPPQLAQMWDQALA